LACSIWVSKVSSPGFCESSVEPFASQARILLPIAYLVVKSFLRRFDYCLLFLDSQIGLGLNIFGLLYLLFLCSL
jgi:hypothetical protein